MKRFQATSLRCLACLMLLPALAAGGCSRAFYRTQADADVERLVEQKVHDPRWEIYDFTIDVDPHSRMFDPFDPDHPPMPPDDPASHRFMHCVDGMRGYCCWHKDGDTPYTENPEWAFYLPVNERGVLALDLREAVQLGLLHSPDYQENLEELYLSALDVSFERYRFDTQFSLTNSTFFTADGPNRNGSGESSSLLTSDTDFQANRLFANGGELMIGLANSLIWQFSGPNTSDTSTLLDFSLVQPLLRGAGRARVLERLTIAERTLLANVRSMERYRKGFYASIATGRNAGQGPSRRGGVFGGSGLEGFTGTGSGGFGGLVTAGGGGGVTGGAGAGTAEGFIGLLQQAQQIRNQQSNVSSLRDSLAQLQAAYEAGRTDRFQVDLAQQALYNAQSQLLTRQNAYETDLDSFKITLGLPPMVPVAIEDRMLSRFELIDPVIPPLQTRLAGLQTSAGQAIIEITDLGVEGEALCTPVFAEGLSQLEADLEAALEVQENAQEHFAAVEADLAALRDNLDERRETLRRLQLVVNEQANETEEGICAPGEETAEGKANAREGAERRDAASEPFADELRRLDTLPDALDADLTALSATFRQAPQRVAAIRAELEWLRENAPSNPAAAEARLIATLGDISDELAELSSNVLELSLIQARAKAETVIITPIDLDSDVAIGIAARLRLDWMNARASLVDAWRLIEFNANDLLSQLDIVFSGDIRNSGDNPLNLDSSTGRLRVGFQFDAPLNRLAERNVYRQSLIEYQQAKRSFYQFEDRVALSLRGTLRALDRDQLNFELRRAAVRVAIDQVELARLRLQEPPKPGAEATFGANIARDLVSALSDLLNAQNDFLSVWVDHEVQRLNLDLDLETMRIDAEGLWIDPGSAIGTAPWFEAYCLPLPPQAHEDEASSELPAPPEPEELPVGRPEA